MDSCIFCKIAAKEIPAQIVFENDEAIAFLDIHPLAPGHVVVVPKSHAENILGLDDKLMMPVFGAVKRVTAMLNKALKPDGFVIGANHGRFPGHEVGVDHLHIHVVPRWKNDGGFSIHGMVHNTPKDSIEIIKDKILKAGLDK